MESRDRLKRKVMKRENQRTTSGAIELVDVLSCGHTIKVSEADQAKQVPSTRRCRACTEARDELKRAQTA